jgi:16S rRNA C967 or C1407 C5-methylase (RsmB/RsmF family)
MRGVLPSEELPDFFSALEEMGRKPRKSIRLRSDLAPETLWTPSRMIEEGIPLVERVEWYDRGWFFDLPRMEPHPSLHPAIAAGLAFIQEAGAMEVVPALETRPHDLVLDLCAAPGAKSTQIGESLSTPGRLVANDPDRGRSKLLGAILSRHGIGNSVVYNLQPHRLAEAFPNLFDRVLVDAPCSGESLFAKREEKRSDVSDKEVERCALRQSAILANAARATAAGGRIVYSTCAYSRAENEDVVAEFLAAQPGFRLEREGRRFPHRDGVPGGYFAVLVSEGVGSDRQEREVRLDEAIRQVGDRGLVRNGIRSWDGSIDPYAWVMNRRKDPRDADAFGEAATRELDRGEVAKLLSDPDGFDRHERGTILYAWEGEPIALRHEGKMHYPKARLR